MPNPIDLDEALFQRIEYYIVHEKMFLQPRLSREDVTNRVYVPRNKFGQLFVRRKEIRHDTHRIQKEITKVPRSPNRNAGLFLYE